MNELTPLEEVLVQEILQRGSVKEALNSLSWEESKGYSILFRIRRRRTKARRLEKRLRGLEKRSPVLAKVLMVIE